MKKLILAAALAVCVPGLAYASCPELQPTDLSNCGPTYTLPQWSTTAGWDQPQYYETIQTADLDGDGRNELLARGALGMYVYTFDQTTGQWTIPRGSTVSLIDLSDANGWDQPQYYQTIQTGDLNGNGKAELLARGPDGLIVYTWDAERNEFDQLGDVTGVFQDQYGWDQPEHYRTIQTADVDGDGRDEVLGRQSDGLATYKWSGGATPILYEKGERIAAFGASIYSNAAYYETIQTGRITESSQAQVVARGSGGLVLYSWNGNGYSDTTPVQMPPGTNPFEGEANDAAGYYRTIQVADLDGDGLEEVFGRDANTSQGQLVAITGAGGEWTLLNEPGFGFEGWNSPANYETIHAADVDGDGDAEIVGIAPPDFRPQGVYVADFDAASRQFIFVSFASPALETDSPWDRRDLYNTIQSAEVNGAPGEELLVRGLYGMRTWVPVDGGYARPVPYGYPPWSPDEQIAYDALNAFLGFTSQEVRDLYAGSNSPNSATISNTATAIAGLCQDELSANPLQYKTCSPPPGSQDVDPTAYTTVSNELLAELFWAGVTLAYFGEQSEILDKLFQNQSATAPSLTDDLHLDQAKNTKTPANYDALFFGVSSAFLSALSTVPDVSIPAKLGAAGIGFLSTLNNASQGTASNVDPVARTYGEILDEVAQQQEQQQDAMEDQRIWIMSDLSLLSAVGAQINSGAFTLDQNAMLSAGRQAFSLWAYQQFLPELWSYYVVTSCKNHTDNDVVYEVKYVCDPPPDGDWYDGPRGKNFNAILDKATKCTSKTTNAGLPVVETDECTFTTPQSTEFSVLTTPLSTECTYDGASSAVWEYNTCTLGVPPTDLFGNLNGWQFDTYACHPGKCSKQDELSTGPASDIRLKRPGTRHSHLALEGSLALDREFDPRRIVAAKLWRILFDIEARVELHDEEDALPLLLAPHSRSSRRVSLRGETDAGTRVDLDIRRKDGQLHFRLDVRRANLRVAQLCEGTAGSKLVVEVEVVDDQGNIIPFAPAVSWSCSAS